MICFDEIFRSWRDLVREGDSNPEPPRSLRVLDFDHTVAFTGEKVYAMSPEGDIVDILSSEEYTHHEFTREEVLAGYYYDFKEFDDVNVEKAIENSHVTSILRNFVNSGSGRIVLILTARNQESESGIRNFLKSIEIDDSQVRVVGVGSSSPQKKVDVVKQILDNYDTITSVSFFDDSEANAKEMKNFLSSYSEKLGRKIDFDVAKVEEDGRLVRMPGYRSKRSRNAKSR